MYISCKIYEIFGDEFGVSFPEAADCERGAGCREGEGGAVKPAAKGSPTDTNHLYIAIFDVVPDIGESTIVYLNETFF